MQLDRICFLSLLLPGDFVVPERGNRDKLDSDLDFVKSSVCLLGGYLIEKLSPTLWTGASVRVDKTLKTHPFKRTFLYFTGVESLMCFLSIN